MPVMVDGDLLEDEEVKRLVKMLENDAYKIAGMFHGMERSKKFRRQWPNEYVYADHNWKHFMVSARAMYADRLGDPKTPPNEAEMMHRALVLQAMMSEAAQAQTPLQLAPGTEAYQGDRQENKRTEESFGIGNSTDALKSRMLRTAARLN